jgi:hypothetical protein
MRHGFSYIPTAAAPPWNPGQDGDLSLWLDAQSITGLTNGQTVTTQMADKSTFGLTTGSVGTPEYLTNYINGHPAVWCNASTSSGLYAVNQQATTDVTIMFVGQSSGGCCGNGIFVEMGGDINSNPGYQLYGDSGQSFGNYRSGTHSYNNVDNGGGSPLGNWAGASATKIIAVFANNSGSGTFMTLSHDGSNVPVLSQFGATGSPLPATTVTANTQIGTRTGSGLYFGCYLFELAIFNSAKNSTWITAANSYISTKWGL